MSGDESYGADGPKPRASETCLTVAGRLMQGVAVLLALAYCLIAAWLVPDIVRRFAYFELWPLLGFGVIFLGACAGLWAVAGLVLKRVQAQLADPARPD